MILLHNIPEEELNNVLTIRTDKNCVFLSTVQDLIETEASPLLTFFICSPNQLNSIQSSIHSIVTYYSVEIFDKGDSSNRQ